MQRLFGRGHRSFFAPPGGVAFAAPNDSGSRLTLLPQTAPTVIMVACGKHTRRGGGRALQQRKKPWGSPLGRGLPHGVSLKGAGAMRAAGNQTEALQYWSIQERISLMRAMRLLGRPERESSWFSPWKRQSFAGHPWNLSAVNMERPSGIQQR